METVMIAIAGRMSGRSGFLSDREHRYPKANRVSVRAPIALAPPRPER